MGAMMDIQSRTRLIKIIVWLVAEATLNLSGMDTIANYSEYVFGQDFTSTTITQPAIVLHL
jgi:hypothetical protein